MTNISPPEDVIERLRDTWPSSLSELARQREQAADTIASLKARAESAERERDQLREALRWQPIETAPTDSTEVLVLVRPKVIRLGWYFAPSGRTQGWCDERGNSIRPTHWMPRPAAPDTARQALKEVE